MKSQEFSVHKTFENIERNASNEKYLEGGTKEGKGGYHILLKLFLKTLAPYNPSDSLLKAVMPQKQSRKIDACCADNASFLTVWVSGAKKGRCMTLSLFLSFFSLLTQIQVYLSHIKQKSLLSQKANSFIEFYYFLERGFTCTAFITIVPV